MTTLLRKPWWLLRHPNKEAELQEELQFHLEEEANDRLERGLSHAEARYASRRELGKYCAGSGGHPCCLDIHLWSV
jgi:hypothetical protein